LTILPKLESLVVEVLGRLVIILWRFAATYVHAKYSRAEADVQRSPINEETVYTGVAPLKSSVSRYILLSNFIKPVNLVRS